MGVGGVTIHFWILIFEVRGAAAAAAHTPPPLKNRQFRTFETANSELMEPPIRNFWNRQFGTYGTANSELLEPPIQNLWNRQLGTYGTPQDV